MQTRTFRAQETETRALRALFSRECFHHAGAFAVRSAGRFNSHGFRSFLVEGALAQVDVNRLLQLAHKGSQGLVASVQAIAYRRSGHLSFLIRNPSLG